MPTHGQIPLRDRMATKRVYHVAGLPRGARAIRDGLDATPHPVVVTDNSGQPVFAMLSLELLSRIEAMLGLEEVAHER